MNIDKTLAHIQPKPAVLYYYQNRGLCMTINPKQRKMSQTSIQYQWQDLFDTLRQLKYCRYEFINEISQKGKLHCHGWIYIQDVPAFIANLHHMKDICTWEIAEPKQEYIDEEDRPKYFNWEDYMKKEIHIWGPFFQKQSIPHIIYKEHIDWLDSPAINFTADNTDAETYRIQKYKHTYTPHPERHPCSIQYDQECQDEIDEAKFHKAQQKSIKECIRVRKVIKQKH